MSPVTAAPAAVKLSDRISRIEPSATMAAVAEAEKLRIDVSPLPGAQVQASVQKLHATPKDIVEKARAAIRP